MTSKAAAAFIAANKVSPVVSGVAHGNGGEGGTYTLKDGRRFRLSASACREVVPRWALPA